VERCPVLEGTSAAVGMAGTVVGRGAFASVGEGTGKSRIVQQVREGRRRRLAPEELARDQPGMLTRGEEDAVIAERAHEFLATAQSSKAGEGQFNCTLHLHVRIFHHASILEAHEPGRQALAIRSPLDLALTSGVHAQAQEVKFGFAEHAAQAEQEPVIVAARGIDPLRVTDEGSA
jgi:hypothetical protein